MIIDNFGDIIGQRNGGENASVVGARLGNDGEVTQDLCLRLVLDGESHSYILGNVGAFDIETDRIDTYIQINFIFRILI